MDTAIVTLTDLKYKTRETLAYLEAGIPVTLVKRGKKIGVINPVNQAKELALKNKEQAKGKKIFKFPQFEFNLTEEDLDRANMYEGRSA